MLRLADLGFEFRVGRRRRAHGLHPAASKPHWHHAQRQLAKGFPTNGIFTQSMNTHFRGIRLPLRCLLGALATTPTVADDTVYFLVGPLPFAGPSTPRESYVLPIPGNRPAELEHARNLIRYLRSPDSWITGRIVMADVAVGSGGINHDLLNPELPAWNWRIWGVPRFVDMTLGIPAKSPAEIAENPSFWTQSGVAFGSYSVIRELGVNPVFVHAVPAPNGVRLNWWSPGTNLVFTVESTASLTAPDWKPIPGTQWPITDRTWTSTGSITDPYFRVIRATSTGN